MKLKGKIYKDDEILVKFRAGAVGATIKSLHKRHGSEKIREFSSLRIHHVKVRKGLGIEDAIKLYRDDPNVEYVEPNYRVTVQATPNDPLFGELWGLNNTINGWTPILMHRRHGILRRAAVML